MKTLFGKTIFVLFVLFLTGCVSSSPQNTQSDPQKSEMSWGEEKIGTMDDTGHIDLADKNSKGTPQQYAGTFIVSVGMGATEDEAIQWIEKGAALDLVVSGGTMLTSAIKKDYKKAANLIVERGANVNLQNDAGRFPLFYAASYSNFEISKLLIDNGANVNLVDNKGNSALLIATQAQNSEIVNLLIRNGANVNVRTKQGFTPLFVASGLNLSEIGEALIKAGADINYVESDSNYTPLIVAVRTDAFDMAKILVNAGADKINKDINGKTAMDLAQEKNSTKMIAILK